MKRSFFLLLAALLLLASKGLNAQTGKDTLVLTDIEWGAGNKAGMQELKIPSAGSMLQGFILKANGAGLHPTLLLLHGYPGNEKNLDLAQVVRARGWNVIYFDYRGSWGSQGTFSFTNCVEDVVSVVSFLKKQGDSLRVDTSNMVLFGHSMGGWICLKALQKLPGIKKGFALSTWDIWGTVNRAKGDFGELEKMMGSYFVLNADTKEQFTPVIINPAYYNLRNDGAALAGKQVIMLDEHTRNAEIAGAIKKVNTSYFDYSVWDTDHPFTNKRIALIKKVLAFLSL